jgi:tetratricopeptide (TPR) repeat protein
MTDYYEVLGIKRNSSLKEVKRSFRRKAKQLHPDLRASTSFLSGGGASDEDMKMLLKAYEVLSNPRKRREYDSLLLYFKPVYRPRFNYREFLKHRKNDLFSQAKLILYDLLHSHSREALVLYEKLSSNGPFRLDLYLNWEDYMDCTFLLAEHLAKEGRFLEAFELFKRIYLDELKRPYFRHFIEEVVIWIKQIACFQLTDVVPPHLNLEYLKELLAFDFPQKDKALFYKRMAEIYSYLGENEMAIEALQRGLRFNRRLPGIKKLKEKIGFPEICVP